MKGKFFMKITSSILTIIFMLTVVTSNITIKADSPKKEIERTIVKEIVEKRTENSKVFLNSDGTYTAKVYQTPIHYKNGDKFEDIDNTLVKEEKKETGGSVYKNKANSIKVAIDEDAESEAPVTLELQNYKVEIKPLKKSSKLEKAKPVLKKDKKQKDDKQPITDDSIAAVEYDNINEDTNIRYTPIDTGVKEEIILNSYHDESTFEFTLNLKDLVPYQQDKGPILLKDKITGEVKGLIEKPYMYDSSRETQFSDNISMSIEKLNDKDKNSSIYKLVLDADKNFLKDKNTVYPVIIDPTTVIQGAGTYDSYVETAYPNSNYATSTQLRAGYDSTTGKVRSYVVFAPLPSIESGVVLSATYYAYGTNSNVAYGNNAYINIHRVLANWWGTSITWNNAPSFDSSVAAQTAVSSPAWYSWNITSLVAGWYSGRYANYGFVMKDS